MSIIEKAVEKLNTGVEDQVGDKRQRPGYGAKAQSDPATSQPSPGGATAPGAGQSQHSSDQRMTVNLPLDLLKNMGMVTPDDPRSRIA